MAARTLKSPPRLLPLYARAAAPLIPGASLLPFVPGGAHSIPEIELLLDEVRVDAGKLAAYAKVCGFALRKHLPITYPHVLAFPLHMAVMADGRFPFGAVGLVHIENRIVQRRPIEIGERLSIRVSPTALSAHPRGAAFTLATEVRADDEVVWEGFSTMLRRGGGVSAAGAVGEDAVRVGGSASSEPAGREPAGGEPVGGESVGGESVGGQQAGPGEREVADRQGEKEAPDAGPRPSASWRLRGDLGRRYAAVSGDRNPIHMHPLSAKLLGFPGAIAHGMWSKARCLAALESCLPEACEAAVQFRKPIVLPAQVHFASNAEISFSLTDARKGIPHLHGTVRPPQQIERSKAT